MAPEIRIYTEAMVDEQAKAHVIVKQAPPMMPHKMIRLSAFLDRELRIAD